MDYKQFIQILKDETEVPNSISLLNEFVNEFPYFQTAHSLLAREMFRQQHIRYEKNLKIAAAYSPDRKALHNLIHPKKTNIFSTEPVVEHPEYISETVSEISVAENLFDGEQGDIIPPDNSTPFEEPVIQKEEQPENNEILSHVEPEKTPTNYQFEDISEAFPEENETDFDEELPPSDPHEIIRRRLNEILGLAKAEAGEQIGDRKSEPAAEKFISPKVEANVYENDNDDREIKTEDNDSLREEIKEIHADTFSEIPAEHKNEFESDPKSRDAMDRIADESAHAVDEIDKAELEHVLEASLIQSLEKLPIIEKRVAVHIREEKESNEPATFLEWLKLKSPEGYGIVEEVKAYDEEKTVETGKQLSSKAESNALIDRFIKDDPRIVASRAEFYSPAIQAKKSVTEDEDLVSETLAGIYRNQGNNFKARSMYEKLSLLYPEKKAYFAALISEIDSEINQPNKEDL